MVILTGLDFQRINFYCKNIVSSKTLEFFFLRVKEEKLTIITIKKQKPRLLKLRRNIQSPAVTKLRMQSVCACDLLEHSGNSL